MGFDARKYEKTIDAVLRTVDLDNITAKRLRRGLEGIFGVDLSANKREIDEMIMERYMNAQQRGQMEEEESSSELEGSRPVKQEETDAVMAARLQSSYNKRQLRGGRVEKKKAAAPKTKKRTLTETQKRTGFNQPYVLSHDLSRLVDSEELSRPQVVKKLWEYIKANNLQDDQDRREIISDDLFARVFGPRINCFTMNKVIKDHMAKRDELASRPAEASANGAVTPNANANANVNDANEESMSEED